MSTIAGGQLAGMSREGRGFAPFAIYRIIVGALVLVFAARLAG